MEVILLKTCAIILSIAVFNLAKAKIVPPKKIFSEYKLSNGRLYKNELTSARFLIQISNALSSNKLVKSHIRQYLSKVKKSKALKEYKVLNNSFRALLKSNGVVQIINTCSKLKTFSSLPSEKYFLKKIDKYCANTGFKRLTRTGKFIHNSHAKLLAKKINFLPNLNKFAHTESIRELFINSRSFNSELTAQLKNTGAPSSPRRVFHHLSYAPTNPLLLEKLSTTDTPELTASGYFYKEFKTIIKTIKFNIKKEKLFEADQSLEYALSFFHENRKFIPKKKALKYVFSATRLAVTHGFNPFARKILNGFRVSLKRYHLDNYSFHMLWSFLEKDSLTNALRYIESSDFKETQSDYDSRVLFWAGYAYHRAGKEEQSKVFFDSIIENNPLGYYSVVAHRLTNREVAYFKDNKKNTPFSLATKNLITRKHASALRRLRIWSRLQANTLVNKEIYHIVSRSNHSQEKNLQEFKRKAILAELATEGSWLEAFKLIFRSYNTGKLTIDKEILSGLFPIQYFNTIKTYKGETDPLLILSLIRQESAFNPNAQSIAGARGLMQLMPATAKEMRRRVKTRHLKIPKVNLQLGIKYLSRLLKKYDGDLILTLASYNAGQGNVRSWINSYLKSENPLMRIEAIPFKETRNYVKFIYRNFFFYNMLLGKKQKENIFDSFKVSAKR